MTGTKGEFFAETNHSDHCICDEITSVKISNERPIYFEMKGIIGLANSV
jgi:hypothetical protein